MTQRGFLSDRFTGTRGLMDAMDTPSLLKERYINNTQCEIEDFTDRGVNPATIEGRKAELELCLAMNDRDWATFAQAFKQSPWASALTITQWFNRL